MRAQHIQPILFAMNNSDTISIRQAAGKGCRSILICCFVILLASGLQAQTRMAASGNPGTMPAESAALLFGAEQHNLSSGTTSDADRKQPGLRSWSPFTSEKISTIKRKGAVSDLPDLMDAREAFDIANAYMAEEDSDARPVNMYGEDSSLFDDFEYKLTAGQNGLIPTGESYFWEVAYLNDADSLVHFTLVVDSEVLEYEVIDIRDFPPQELPPIPLSELKSIPAEFISSKAALAAARANGLNDLLPITELDGWFALDYNLGGFFFEFPGLLDSDSPVFWDVLFDGHAWDEQEDRPVWVEANFLIDALTGNLLGKLVFTSEDEVLAQDFMDIYTMLGGEMLGINPDAVLIQAFGQEEDLLPDMPLGISSEWMAVWFDAEAEYVYMFLTRNGILFGQNFFPLSDIPVDERPPADHFRAIGLHFGSAHALNTSLDAGLRQQLEQAPPETQARINYHLHNGYYMFPEILDEESNPFWHLEVEVEAFNEEWQRVYHKIYHHLVDAVTGQYLGSATETSVEDVRGLPARIALHQNYPNPFNPETRILWEMNDEQHVTLSVYDLLGRRAAQLVDGVYPAGEHSITYDASALSSGVYIYRLVTGGTVLNRKMTVVK